MMYRLQTTATLCKLPETGGHSEAFRPLGRARQTVTLGHNGHTTRGGSGPSLLSVRIDDHLPPQQSVARAPTGAHSFRETLLGGTRISVASARALLGAAWKSVVGGEPASHTAQLLTAHWALETDAGRAMPGFNFAGLKAEPNARGAFLQTVEGYGATRRELCARFRVYDTPEAGAHDYVRLLAAHYPTAIDAAQAGNVAAFAHALAAGGYFTADPETYQRGLEQRFNAPDGAPSPGPSAALTWTARGALDGLLRALRHEPDDA